MLKLVIFPVLLTLVLKLSSRNFPVERATEPWQSMTKTTSCKKTSESPGCSSSLIGQNFFFLANQKWAIQTLLEHFVSTAWRLPLHGPRNYVDWSFWNWFGKSKCPGARLDFTVNFHHGHFIDPTNCPWVSEDRVNKQGFEWNKNLKDHWMKWINSACQKAARRYSAKWYVLRRPKRHTRNKTQTEN